MGTFTSQRCEPSGSFYPLRLASKTCVFFAQEFLFYYEKCPPGHIRDKENPLLDDRLRKQWDPLVKQTYSVWVDGPKGRRKWHLSKRLPLSSNEHTHIPAQAAKMRMVHQEYSLTVFPSISLYETLAAYFTQATVDRLQTVDEIPELVNLDVPPGKYISTRLGKPRRPDETLNAGSANNGTANVHDVFRPANASALRTYAPFPLPYEAAPQANGGQNMHLTAQHQYGQQHPGPTPPPFNAYDFSQYPQRPFRDRSERNDFYGAMHPSGYSDNTLTLPPINASASISGAPSSDRHYSEYSPTNAQQGPSHLDARYQSYPSQGSEQHRAPYLPPTPTVSSSQYGSPIYPTPTSVSPHDYFNNHMGHPGAPQHQQHREPYPSPFPSPPAQKFPSMSPQNYHNPASHPPPEHSPIHLEKTAFPLSPVTGVPSSARIDLPYTYDPRIDPRLLAEETESSEKISQSHPEVSPRVPTLRLPSPRRHSPQDVAGRDEQEDEDVATCSPRSTASTASAVGAKRLDLAPLRTLVRAHPYRRDKFDDKALMAFSAGRRNSD